MVRAFKTKLSPQSWHVAFILLICYVSNGSSIKCFVCDSSDNPSCADLKSNSSIVPEECTLDKMKSLDTWLFDLNKFSYFDTGANKNPLMNCQKVVARDPETMKMVTARFCQLDTGDSDACAILRSKLRINNDGSYEQTGRRNVKGKLSDGKSEEQRFYCSICNSDRCNGGSIPAAQIMTCVLLPAIFKLVHRCLW